MTLAKRALTAAVIACVTVGIPAGVTFAGASWG